MKEERPLLILMLTTSVLLVGDLVYRSVVKPQNFNDLLVVMAGVVICECLIFPKSMMTKRSVYRNILGGVIGAVLGLGGVALRDYLTKGDIFWGSYLSTALGFAIAFILFLVFARLVGWEES